MFSIAEACPECKREPNKGFHHIPSQLVISCSYSKWVELGITLQTCLAKKIDSDGPPEQASKFNVTKSQTLVSLLVLLLIKVGKLESSLLLNLKHPIPALLGHTGF